ncbi:MAG TPA: CBS domain-containing protein [Candidatus Aenigmarchaeota archaeon]|nr:CBS domain-containing protein [Candidatus Aenigmarchaeota archaeon]
MVEKRIKKKDSFLELEKLKKEVLKEEKRKTVKKRGKAKEKVKKTRVEKEKSKKREMVRESTVEEIMTRHVIKVKPDDNLSYVVQLLAEKNISGLPVVEGNKFVGVISESDIIRVVGSKSLLELDTLGLKKLRDIKVREVMNKKPIAIYVKSKVSKAADLMNKYDISRLPVINERGELVGIVTKKDIIKGISKDFLVRVIKEPEKLGVEFIETDLDEILKIVEREGSVSIDEIKKRLEIPEEKIEEWGRILEKHNLIEVYYPPVGKPIFKKKEVKLK